MDIDRNRDANQGRKSVILSFPFFIATMSNIFVPLLKGYRLGRGFENQWHVSGSQAGRNLTKGGTQQTGRWLLSHPGLCSQAFGVEVSQQKAPQSTFLLIQTFNSAFRMLLCRSSYLELKLQQILEEIQSLPFKLRIQWKTPFTQAFFHQTFVENVICPWQRKVI